MLARKINTIHTIPLCYNFLQYTARRLYNMSRGGNPCCEFYGVIWFSVFLYRSIFIVISEITAQVIKRISSTVKFLLFGKYIMIFYGAYLVFSILYSNNAFSLLYNYGVNVLSVVWHRNYRCFTNSLTV